MKIVAREGIEPSTSGLWIRRSNHLSYLAKKRTKHFADLNSSPAPAGYESDALTTWATPPKKEQYT